MFSDLRLRVDDARLFLLPMRTRMPFRYGIARVVELNHCILQLEVRRSIAPGYYMPYAKAQNIFARGLAADHLAPKWFTKNPETSYEADVTEMLRVIRQAMQFALAAEPGTPFEMWQQVYRAQSEWGKAEGLVPLLTQFGASLVERALIDGFCQMRDAPFATLLRENAFGIHLGSVHSELEGFQPADFLPAKPLERVRIRHTVGLSDPLWEADIAFEERAGDNLPQSLEACIRLDGVRHFKIKVGGDPEADTTRLVRVFAVIAAYAPMDWAFSLDGNESYKSFEDLQLLWMEMQTHPGLSPYLSRLLFFEQPLHRDVALSPVTKNGFEQWADGPTVVIDESDAGLDSLPRALSLGYAGTSHKNCKGVFKSIANACLLEHRCRQNPNQSLLLTGEDLSNVGPIALHQDLAVQAALGIESVERNGHHYFAGLTPFPSEVQTSVAALHPDLYDTHAGFPALNIENGYISLKTINETPFGHFRYQEHADPQAWAEDVTEVKS